MRSLCSCQRALCLAAWPPRHALKGQSFKTSVGQQKSRPHGRPTDGIRSDPIRPRPPHVGELPVCSRPARRRQRRLDVQPRSWRHAGRAGNPSMRIRLFELYGSRLRTAFLSPQLPADESATEKPQRPLGCYGRERLSHTGAPLSRAFLNRTRRFSLLRRRAVVDSGPQVPAAGREHATAERFGPTPPCAGGGPSRCHDGRVVAGQPRELRSGGEGAQPACASGRCDFVMRRASWFPLQRLTLPRTRATSPGRDTAGRGKPRNSHTQISLNNVMLRC